MKDIQINLQTIKKYLPKAKELFLKKIEFLMMLLLVLASVFLYYIFFEKIYNPVFIESKKPITRIKTINENLLNSAVNLISNNNQKRVEIKNNPFNLK